jgi:hypothetical protein
MEEALKFPTLMNEHEWIGSELEHSYLGLFFNKMNC